MGESGGTTACLVVMGALSTSGNRPADNVLLHSPLIRVAIIVADTHHTYNIIIIISTAGCIAGTAALMELDVFCRCRLPSCAGAVDDLGVMPLLRRGVTNIVICLATHKNPDSTIKAFAESKLPH